MRVCVRAYVSVDLCAYENMGGGAYWAQDRKRVCQSLCPELRLEPVGKLQLWEELRREQGKAYQPHSPF